MVVGIVVPKGWVNVADIAMVDLDFSIPAGLTARPGINRICSCVGGNRGGNLS